MPDPFMDRESLDDLLTRVAARAHRYLTEVDAWDHFAVPVLFAVTWVALFGWVLARGG